MKRMGFLLVLVCLLLAACGVFAEEYAGTWYVVSYSDAEGLQQPVLPMLGFVPGIELRDDHTAEVSFGGAAAPGSWHPAEDGRIAVATDSAGEMLLTPDGDKLRLEKLPFADDAGDAVLKDVVLKREDPCSPVGEWFYLMAADGKGNSWYVESNYSRLVLNGDGTAQQYSLFDGNVVNQSFGTWERAGNDIVYYLRAKDPEGSTISVPYQFFWLDGGILFNRTQEDQQEPILWMRANDSSKKQLKRVEDLSAFLGTAWKICGVDMNGCLVPFDLIGLESGDYISFGVDGFCTHIYSEVYSDESSVRLEDGNIRFIFPKKKNVLRACMTEDGYLMTTEEGQGFSFYFRPDDEKSEKKDLRVPENSVWSLSVSEQNSTGAAFGGDQLAFTAEFSDPSVVNRNAKNNTVTWFVTDPEGNAAEGVKIDNRGRLTVDAGLEKAGTLIVTAVSDWYGTRDSYELAVYPAAKSIEIQPESVELFVGQTAELSVEVLPADTPRDCLELNAGRQDLAEIEKKENGNYMFTAVKAGEANLTLLAPGGAKRRFQLTVKEPVTGLALKLRDGEKPRPGYTVSIQAEITPRAASDKSLTWEIDEACGDLASINGRGQLAISGSAASGSVIIVYCTASGAPEPIRESIEIPVQ